MGSRRKKRLSYEGKGNSCVVCHQPNITRPLRSSKDVLACLKSFRDKKVEYFVTLSLDSAGRLIRRRVVTIGLLSVSLVGVREVFAGPLRDAASGVIICHNHPSGIPEPSSEDIKTTQQIVAAGILLGIPLKDHFIVTERGYFSFQEQGLLVDS